MNKMAKINICLTDFKKSSRQWLSDKDAKSLFDDLRERVKAKERVRISNNGDNYNATVEEILEEERQRAKQARINTYKTIIAKKNVENFIKNSGLPPGEALIACLAGTVKTAKKGRFSTEKLMDTYKTRFQQNLINHLERSKLYSYYIDDNNNQNIAEELFKEGSTNDNNAKTVAGFIRESYEKARTLANFYGANIGKLDDFIAHQIHDPVRLSMTGGVIDHIKNRIKLIKEFGFKEGNQRLSDMAYQQWRDFIVDRLDADRTFATIDDKEKFLKSIYVSLKTGVRITSPNTHIGDLTSFRKPGNLAERISTSRKIHFKDGKSWLEYNRRYGSGDFYTSVNHTLETMGRNVGMLHRWGPNPRALFDRVSKEILEQNRESTDLKKIQAQLNRASKYFKFLDGSAYQAENPTAARIFSNIRSAQSLTKLGGVVLSSVPDIGNVMSILRDNGVSLADAHVQFVQTFMKNLSPSQRREMGSLIGIWTDSIKGGLKSRFSAFDSSAGQMAKALQVFFKLNGLHAWDGAIRTSFGEILAKHLANLRDNVFENLPKELQTTFDLYGIGEKEWDFYRNNAVKPYGNKTYITYDVVEDASDEAIKSYLDNDNATKREIMEAREDLSSKLGTYFIDQRSFASVEPDVIDRAFALQPNSAGTFSGELLRFLSHFKSFNIAYTRKMFYRTLVRNQRFNLAGINGILTLMTNLTVWGVASITLKDIANGLTPPDFTNPNNWLRALEQGGGFGIFSSFLFNDYSKYGHSFTTDLAGPEFGTIDDVVKLIDAIATHNEPSRALQNLISRNAIPKLWYTNAAMRWLFLNRWQEATSPGSVQRYLNNLQQDRNQTSWLPLPN